MSDDEPVTFGYDVLDTLRLNWLDDLAHVLDVIESGYNFGFDVIDVINEGRERDIPTHCTQCGEAWLMGPEALASGKCWRCRTQDRGLR